jgi:uncharacterized protein (DUF427 family)
VIDVMVASGSRNAEAPSDVATCDDDTEWTVVRARWKGQVIAESDDTIVLEGNHYFPPEAVHPAFLEHSDDHTICGWKGTASYYDVVVDGEVNRGAAWYYADPKPAASDIKNYIAFWRGVRVED